MTSERIKEIQEETAYPNSVSVQQALLKVWNECVQEPKQETLEEVGMYQQELFNYLHDLGVTALQSEMQEIERIVLGMQQENSNINALDFEINALKREIKVFKHQQEQDKKMYSEEEVLEMLEDYDREFKLDTFAYTNPCSFTVKEWFETVKKK